MTVKAISRSTRLIGKLRKSVTGWARKKSREAVLTDAEGFGGQEVMLDGICKRIFHGTEENRLAVDVPIIRQII